MCSIHGEFVQSVRLKVRLKVRLEGCLVRILYRCWLSLFYHFFTLDQLCMRAKEQRDATNSSLS